MTEINFDHTRNAASQSAVEHIGLSNQTLSQTTTTNDRPNPRITSSTSEGIRAPLNRVPSFLNDFDKTTVQHTLGVKQPKSGQRSQGSDDPVNSYEFDENDTETQKNITDIRDARQYAKNLLNDKNHKYTSMQEEEALKTFSKIDDLVRSSFGRIAFSYTRPLYKGAESKDDILRLNKTLLQEIIQGPHYARTEKYRYTKGGLLDIFDPFAPNQKTRVSGTSNNQYKLQSNKSIDSNESTAIKQKVDHYLKYSNVIPNPEHQRQVLLATMLLNSMRLHCESSGFRFLSKKGINVPGVTRDFCDETIKSFKAQAQISRLDKVSHIVDDVEQELRLEFSNWRNTNKGSFWSPVTFKLY